MKLWTAFGKFLVGAATIAAALATVYSAYFRDDPALKIELAEPTPQVERSDDVVPKDKPKAVAGKEVSPHLYELIEGEWFTGGNTGFFIEFDNSVATITRGGNGSRPDGTDLLRIDRVDGMLFWGQQRFSDGRWVDVSGEYKNGRLYLTGAGYDWDWGRP